MNTLTRFSLSAWLCLILTSPVALAESGPPLAERIWDVKNETFIDAAALAQELMQGDFVLLGETHDNRRHHEVQAHIIDNLATAGRKPQIVFEMISDTQYEALAKTNPREVGGYFDALEWEANGWPDRALYTPVFDVVIRHGLPIKPGNVDRKRLRALIEQGEEALPLELAAFIEAVPLNEATRSAFAQEIAASHCDMLPDNMVAPMILGQRSRDALMTKSLLDRGASEVSVLIAGSGHVRNDRGVPAYLQRFSPTARITTVAIVETRADVDDPTAYAQAWGADVLPFDFVWFTPATDRQDPCEEMRKYMMKHHPKG